MNHTYLDKLREIYKEMNLIFFEFGDVVIAGGAVRDSIVGVEPKDYDVYVINAKGDKWNEIADLIRNKINTRFAVVKPPIDWHKSEPFLVETFYFQKNEIQVMLRNVTTIEELVDTFDWNVSLYAYGANGPYIHKNAALLSIPFSEQELKLNKITYPYSSLRRGFRFSERFLMKLPHREINKIIGKMSNKNKFIDGEGI